MHHNVSDLPGNVEKGTDAHIGIHERGGRHLARILRDPAVVPLEEIRRHSIHGHASRQIQHVDRPPRPRFPLQPGHKLIHHRGEHIARVANRRRREQRHDGLGPMRPLRRRQRREDRGTPVDVELAVGARLLEPSPVQVDRRDGLPVRDVDVVGADSQHGSVFLVQGVDDGAFVADVCVVGQPQGSACCEWRAWDLGQRVEEETVDACPEEARKKRDEQCSWICRQVQVLEHRRDRHLLD